MRIRLAYLILILVFVVLLTRVYQISIKSNKYYERLAMNNIIKTEQIPPVRGQIFDRNSKPLAVNKLGFAIAVAPHLNRTGEELRSDIEMIVKFFPKFNVEDLLKEYAKNDSPYNQNFVTIIDYIDYDEMFLAYAQLNLRPNLLIIPINKRFYPYGKVASHVIGYVGRSNLDDVQTDEVAKLTNYIGKSGVEKFYNSTLQGEAGEHKIKITALNQKVQELEFTAPTSNDITLTIDIQLQEFISEIFKDNAGAAIVMDLDDGSILAAGSFPEYDLNPFVHGVSQEAWQIIISDLNHPFTNKLVNSLYPPGSVAKMTVGMAFFNSGKISPMTRIVCDPYFELGDRKFRNWREWGYSEMTIVDALRESCDTYFYRGAYQVGIDAISPILIKFGFGRKTGVDLPNEYIGIAPSRDWKYRRFGQKWFDGDTMNVSIGQGNFLTTPMQVVKNTAFFVTGEELTPHFLQKINDQDAIWEKTSPLTKNEKYFMNYIKKGMFEVANVKGGTALYPLSAANIKLGAKTGTAQVVGISQTEKKRIKEADMEYFMRSHAWITTYGPVQAPKYAVTVLVEHGASGSGTAGPIAAQIYNKLVELGYIDQKYIRKDKPPI